MATSRPCFASVRPLLRDQGLTCTKILNSPRLSQRRSFFSPTPLYLDFLAPSWRASLSHQAQRRQAPSSPSRHLECTRRAYSKTTPLAARATVNPRKDDDGNEMLISITPRAAHRLQAIAAKDDNPELTLRVSVESGGCHGFQYLMSLVKTSDIDPEMDTVFEEDSGKDGYQAKVVMDEPSLELLKGSSVDYTMELIGSQFKVTGIPGAKSSCGCGTSFDIAA